MTRQRWEYLVGRAGGWICAIEIQGATMQKVPAMILVVFLISVTLATLSFAGGPMFWEQSSFRDFQQGKVMGCSIAQEGSITLAPAMKAVYSTDQVLVWSMVKDSQGNLFLGTGHGGKVFKVDLQNQGKLFYTAKELDVFALAVDAGNNLYVGTSPDGKVYKVAPDGSASEFFNPQAKYIWSMTFDHDGNLFVGTGEQGKIYKVDASGKGTVFYDTRQTHVMSMEMDNQGNVLAGTYPDGMLFRISPAGKGFVLYDSPLQEVHSISVGDDGSIYMGCLSEKMPQRPIPGGMPQSMPQSDSSAPGGVTVVVSEPIQVSTEGQPGGGMAQAFAPGASTGVLRSAIYRIAPDLSVETLWGSRDESVYDLQVFDNKILFGTDSRGRLYEIQPDRKIHLLAQTNEAQASHLIRRGQSVFVSTSNAGKLYELGFSSPLSGSVESSIKDAQFISKWGIISWEGEVPAGTGLQFYTRTGNSDKPGATWSDWSAAYTHAEGEQVTSPSARFIQWKAELKGNDKMSPRIAAIRIAYLPQNIRPEITSISVTPQGLGSQQRSGFDASTGGASEGDSKGGAVSADSSASVTVVAYPTATPSPNRVTISWQAEDKNHDTLEYAVYIRGLQDSGWRLLKDNLRETTFVLDPETLPDGRYRARVVASDAPSNPARTALSTEMESEIFLIDNTPPTVEVTAKTVEGNTVTVHFRATDGASELRRAEFSIDSGKWQITESDDGIVDSRFEEFTVRASDLSPGEHVITLRVYDSSGNPGLAKAVANLPVK
jgi:sugar lactone lactonase YvrE